VKRPHRKAWIGLGKLAVHELHEFDKGNREKGKRAVHELHELHEFHDKKGIIKEIPDVKKKGPGRYIKG